MLVPTDCFLFYTFFHLGGSMYIYEYQLRCVDQVLYLELNSTSTSIIELKFVLQKDGLNFVSPSDTNNDVSL